MMFYDGNGGWHPWMLALMLVGMLLFWALVIWGAVFLFRGSGSGSRDSGQADPEQILKERLGRGEISTEV
jgi:putative membrane protein